MRFVVVAFICLNLVGACFAQDQLCLDWRKLAAKKSIPRYEYCSSESLDPAWKGDGVVVLSKREWLFDFKPEIAGKLRLTFKVPGGSEFGPYSVFLNGVKLGEIRSPDGVVTQRVQTFATEHVAAQSNLLRIAVPEGRKLGLCAISWTAAAWSDAPAVSEFTLFNPIPRRCFMVRTAPGDALELRVNGKLVEISDNRGWIPWRYLKKGLNNIGLASDKPVSLQFNRVEDVKFFTEPPLALTPKVEDGKTYRLENEQLKLVVAGGDYYLGNRFESAGMLVSAVFAGQECARSLVVPHDPTNDGAGCGTAEEFSEAVGYEQAKLGEPFLKVGVGLFEKDCDEDFSFGGGYFPLMRFGWELVEQRRDRLTWRQVVDGPRGWGYEYVKTLKLAGEGAGFSIEHTLKNTGRHRIVTSQFSHNVFKLGAGPVGEDDSVTFAFPLSGKHIYGSKAKMGQAGFSFSRFSGNYFARLTGFATLEDCQALIRNRAYQIGLKIEGDFVPGKMFFYATDTCICPEFFKRIDLASDETASWTRRYTFFQADNVLRKEK
jgi:hypothetical protein